MRHIFLYTDFICSEVSAIKIILSFTGKLSWGKSGYVFCGWCVLHESSFKLCGLSFKRFKPPEIGLFTPPLKATHSIMLKVWIQSSWRGFTVFLEDTSAGQMIANKRAWMLVFLLEPPCCNKAKPNRSTKTSNNSRALSSAVCQNRNPIFCLTKGANTRPCRTFSLTCLLQPQRADI